MLGNDRNRPQRLRARRPRGRRRPDDTTHPNDPSPAGSPPAGRVDRPAGGPAPEDSDGDGDEGEGDGDGDGATGPPGTEVTTEPAEADPLILERLKAFLRDDRS